MAEIRKTDCEHISPLWENAPVAAGDRGTFRPLEIIVPIENIYVSVVTESTKALHLQTD